MSAFDPLRTLRSPHILAVMGSWLPGAIFLGVAVAVALTSTTASAAIRLALPSALEQMTRAGKFSGAIVIRGPEGVRFARGYGLADPFTGRRFNPDTPIDSASLAKPVTAAGVLMLARDGKIDLDAPVRRYLREYPHTSTTVRHLLAHSAGLPFDDAPDALFGKTNAALLAGVSGEPQFQPGSAFAYCNLCYVTLALLIERVSGMRYLDFARSRLALPRAVTLRPLRLDEWQGRAIGHRRTAAGKVERFDSWEGEAFYGTANLSISAHQLAKWGAQWWQPRLSRIRSMATTRAAIAGKRSGLTFGNWYCAPTGPRCHYLGHHEGFHHMLYWDAKRRISVAMLSNNALSPALHHRLQRALVSFAERSGADPAQELSKPLPDNPVTTGNYKFVTGEAVTVIAKDIGVGVIRRGITYPAVRVGSGIRYVPGLDVYVAGADGAGLHWLSLYEDMVGARIQRQP